MLSYCENCERVIGNLERSFAYESHTVCADCYARLAPLPEAAPPAAPVQWQREMAPSHAERIRHIQATVIFDPPPAPAPRWDYRAASRTAVQAGTRALQATTRAARSTGRWTKDAVAHLRVPLRFAVSHPFRNRRAT